MNEVLNAISTRYSCRAFDGVMPDDEKLRTIAEAALAAPSGVNAQPWRVIVLKNRRLIDELEQEGMSVLKAAPDPSAYNRIMGRGGAMFYNAPCMIIVPVDAASKWADVDCGILCQTVALAAESLGINSLICGMARLPFSGDKAEYFKEELDFPPEFELGVAILLGYALGPTQQPHNLDMEKITVID